MTYVRSLTNRHTALLILTGTLIAGVFAVSNMTVNVSRRLGAPEAPAVADSFLRAEIAYGARWQALANSYAPETADAARWQGLADQYLKKLAAQKAEAARWAGLAGLYRQRAIEAYAARWEGLAATYQPPSNLEP